MIKNKITTFFSSLVFMVLINIIPNIAHAATTDCIGTATDGIAGTVPCIKATELWVGDIDVGTNKFNTFKQYEAFAVSEMCKSHSLYICGERTIVEDYAGKTCNPGQTSICNNITTFNYDSTQSLVMTYYYINNDDPGNQHYYLNGSWAHNYFICPSYAYTMVTTTGVNPIMLCKTSGSIVNSAKNTCPTGTCPGSNPKYNSWYSKLLGFVTGGDPVDLISGNKYMVENDYTYNSFWPIGFTRTYSSKNDEWKHNWKYQLTYIDMDSVKVVTITLPNGSLFSYQLDPSTNNWTSGDLNDRNKLSLDSNIFTLKLDNNTKITFTPTIGSDLTNQNYWIASSVNTLGNGEYTLTYDNDRRVTKVSNPAGVELLLGYANLPANCDQSLVTSITGGNQSTTYEYSNGCNINKVVYPDGSFKTYTYQSGLNEVKDELQNSIHATYYRYVNDLGQSVFMDGINSNVTVDKVGIDYSANYNTVTDGRNNSTDINLTTVNGIKKPSSYSTLCTWCDGIQGSAITYNTNGYMNSVTDFNGNVTKYDYDNSRNLLTQTTEAFGTPVQRQTNVTYDSTWNLPATVTEPSSVAGSNKVTTNTYDQTTGRLLTKTVSAPQSYTGGSTINKTWTLNYDSLGRLSENIGPMNDKVTYTYNSTGQVESIINALNQTTSFSNFDSFGNANHIAYPDNTSVDLVYNTRGKVVSITKNNSDSSSSYTSSLTRNAAQLVTQVTSPSGSFQTLTYDTTQRLTSVAQYDETGTLQGTSSFTLDNMSNVTTVQIFDSSNTQIRVSTKEYNSKNLLYRDLTSLNNANVYSYDSNGNISTISDPLGKTVSLTYDALNRVATQTSQDLGITTYTYNPDDSIASIKDATNATTHYKYNGFGELVKMISPDTGVTNIVRDLSGNIVTKTDARGIAVNYTYDALHRPTNVTYPNSNENVTITYDQCTSGIGKVCTVHDISGLTSYSYNSFSQLESKTYTAGAFTKSIHYAYDNVGRLNKVTYPSNMEVNYTYANDKPVTVSYTVNGNSNNVITNGVYDPFSSEIKSYQYSNGASYTKTFNQDGLIASINSGIYGFSQTYNYDSRLNISGITGTTSATVTYDDNSRITNFNNIVYNYTKNGNRTSVNNNGNSFNYSTLANSNRLSSVNGYNLGYDLTGNQTSDNSKTFGYNNAGSLISYNDSTHNYSYLVNSGSQRVKKSDNTDSTNNIWFIYDANGQVISEYAENGSVINEYIYLNGVPVGLVKNNQLYNIYPDHLGTPRVVTNSNNGVVWKWDNTDPFGANLPIIATIEFNLRFPGQYFDKESNLHYNYHRTYNPKTGRYIQSDPLGLAAGNNTYGYVDGNSLSGFDPLGLDVWIEGSSDDEPGAHLSISIGNPNGKYIAYSFGANMKYFGQVYIDNSSPGAIIKMLSSTQQQDAAIIVYLNNLRDIDDKKYYVWDYTCIGYSKEKFEQIKFKFNLKEKSFGPRNIKRGIRNIGALFTSSSSIDGTL